MSKPIENLGTKLLFEAPVACSLLFAGIGAYMSQGDPQVREQLTNTKHQLKHWAKMYQIGKSFMPVIAATGAATAVSCYQKTKDNLWLYGAATLLGIIPYTLLVMGKTNGDLNTILSNSETEELLEPQRVTVTQSMKRWVHLHRGRVLLAITSAAIFFVARHKSQ